MRKIHITVIEDNRLLREGLTTLLSAEEDFVVLNGWSNTDPAPHGRGPQVILLDIGLRNQSSLRLLESIRKHTPEAKVIIMDLIPMEMELLDYVSAGAWGFVLKDATFNDFLETIRAVARGAKILPTSLTNSLFSQIVERAAGGRKSASIMAIRMTGREREVVELIAEGMSNKEIAKRLNLATDTVKSHVHNILEKLDLHTRLEVASFTHRSRSPHYPARRAESSDK